MKQIQHIFFDLDHTLWDFDHNSKLAYQEIFTIHEISLELEKFLEKYQSINARYWKLYREDKVDKEALRRGRLIDTFKAFNIDYPIKKIDKIAEDYVEMLPLHNHLIDDTLQILEYLYPKYTLHIITNGFEDVQKKKLERSGISKYFETVTTSEAVGAKKPSPLVFKYALTKANAEVHNSLMIGDNYEADIIGAHEFGIATICFNYHQEVIAKEFVEINKLSEVKKYL